MLQSILDFFDQRIRTGEAADRAPALQRATAALLAEMVHIDREVTAEERLLAERAIRERFGLAADEVRQANDYYQFTSLINRDFTQPEKEAMVETLWAVAYADGALSAHEQHLMRKVAGLLHVPDSAYIAAKMRAKAAAGVGD